MLIAEASLQTPSAARALNEVQGKRPGTLWVGRQLLAQPICPSK